MCLYICAYILIYVCMDTLCLRLYVKIMCCYFYSFIFSGEKKNIPKKDTTRRESGVDAGLGSEAYEGDEEGEGVAFIGMVEEVAHDFRGRYYITRTKHT